VSSVCKMAPTQRQCYAVVWASLMVTVALAATAPSSVFDALEKPSFLAHVDFDDYVPGQPFDIAGGVFPPGTSVTSDIQRTDVGHAAAGLYCRADATMHLPVGIGAASMPSVTFGAWVRPTASLALDEIGPVLSTFSDENDLLFGRSLLLANVGNSLYWAIAAGATRDDLLVLGEAEAVVNEWQFVAATYNSDSGRVSLFVDGVVVEDVIPETLPEGPTLNICQQLTSNSASPYYGDVDDVFVFNEVLQYNELQFLRQNTWISTQTPAASSAGYSVRFKTGFASVPLSADGNEGQFPASVLLWVKPTDVKTGTSRCLYELRSQKNDIQFVLLVESPIAGSGTQAGSEVRFRLQLFAGDQESAVVDWIISGVVSSDTWTHVGVVFNEETPSFTVFVNGHEASRLSLASNTRFQEIDIGSLIFDALNFGALHLDAATTSSFFVGELDEAAIYSRPLVDSEVFQTYKHSHALVGDAADGLEAYWRFDEGCGMRVVNQALAGVSLDLLLDASLFLANEQPWTVASTPIDNALSTDITTALPFVLNGSHCAYEGKPFKIRLDSVPSIGSVHILEDSSSQLAGTELSAGDVVEQLERLVYVPEPTFQASYEATLQYVIGGIDGFVDASAPSTVTISVVAEDDVLPQLGMDDTVLTIAGYAVADTDAAEGTNSIDMTIGFESDSLDTTLRLGSSNGLNFEEGSQSRSIAGSAGPLEFYGAPDSISSAIDHIELSMAASQGEATFSVTASDLGTSDALSDTVQMSVALRSGATPVLDSVFPSTGSPSGNYYVTLSGANFGDMALACVFDGSFN